MPSNTDTHGQIAACLLNTEQQLFRVFEILLPQEPAAASALGFISVNRTELLNIYIDASEQAVKRFSLLASDAIIIILEEASKGCPPLSVPVACIKAGTNHSLPILALRLFLASYVMLELITVGTGSDMPAT
ncbi:hypothetical protein KSS87_020253, partial [Heliosperma pusillum]